LNGNGCGVLLTDASTSVRLVLKSPPARPGGLNGRRVAETIAVSVAGCDAAVVLKAAEHALDGECLIMVLLVPHAAPLVVYKVDSLTRSLAD
jgi:hypothetical protein